MINPILTNIKIAINRQIINKNERSSNLATDFENMELTPTQIATAINQGFAIAPQHHTRRKAENFLAAHYIGLDFDHLNSERDVLDNLFVKAYGSIIYHTPSSKPDAPRMRVLFFLENHITNSDTYREMVLALLWGCHAERCVKRGS